jgi:transcriptional regulator with XRE-family HTH domain
MANFHNNYWLLAWLRMTLKEVFIHNLKEFRKKEGLSQMKLAEYCNTSPGYIGEIEIGRKFPSTEMIEKIAFVLRIEPYLFFKNPKDNRFFSVNEIINRY